MEGHRALVLRHPLFFSCSRHAPALGWRTSHGYCWDRDNEGGGQNAATAWVDVGMGGFKMTPQVSGPGEEDRHT